MRSLEDAFTTLLGKQPTDQEKQDLYRTRDALNLKNDDAIWLLLMALGHYETLYRRFPALIAEAAATTLTKTKDVAEAALKASASAAQRELTAALVRKAETLVPEAARSRTLAWAVGRMVTAALFLYLLGWSVHRQGISAGLSRGWAEARGTCIDEKAAAAWANTPEGQLAYGLARAGSILHLANCSGRGWVQKGGICFPRSDNGSVYGWRLRTNSIHDGRDQ